MNCIRKIFQQRQHRRILLQLSFEGSLSDRREFSLHCDSRIITNPRFVSCRLVLFRCNLSAYLYLVVQIDCIRKIFQQRQHRRILLHLALKAHCLTEGSLSLHCDFRISTTSRFVSCRLVIFCCNLSASLY